MTPEEYILFRRFCMQRARKARFRESYRQNGGLAPENCHKNTHLTMYNLMVGKP